MAKYRDNEKIMRRLSEEKFGNDHFDLSSLPDSDGLLPVEQAHALARLEDELTELGLIGGRRERAAGTPLAAALWAVVPQGTRVGGAVWGRIWRGVQAAYAEK